MEQCGTSSLFLNCVICGRIGDEMKTPLERKLEEYVDSFHENFPIFLFRNVPEERIIEMIDSCIQKGESMQVEAPEKDI